MLVSRHAIPASTCFRRHEHESVHLCALLGGGLSEDHGRQRREMGPGDLRLSPATRHDIEFSPDGADCLLFEVEAELVEPLRGSLFVTGQQHIARLVAALGRAAARRDAARDLALETLAVELVAQVERLRGGRRLPPPPWLERVRERLHHETEPPSVGSLASTAGVHRVYLARAFRDHYGTSVTAYRKRLRLERAVRLVRATAVPLAEVAAETGFADQSHMTRAMRLALGTTPARLREA